jgi:hypothetical protein
MCPDGQIETDRYRTYGAVGDLDGNEIVWGEALRIYKHAAPPEQKIEVSKHPSITIPHKAIQEI